MTSEERPVALRALVVYESMFGDTAAIAEAVSRGLRATFTDVRCVEVDALDADVRPSTDLLVVGAPTHRYDLSSPGTREDAVRQGAAPGHAALGIREWLMQEAPRATCGVAIFDTRLEALQRIHVAAAPAIAERLSRLGVRVVGAPMGFLVTGTRGPLVDGEAERAETWGRALAAEVGVAPQG